VAALVAVLGLGLVLGDAGDGGDDEAATSTTTTRRRATTSSTASTTTLPVGPVLPVQTGASLLLANGSATWTLLDLDTGTRRDVPIQSQDPYSAVPVAGGIVVLRGETAEYVRVIGGDAEPVRLGPAAQVFASGSPDRVWLAQFGREAPRVLASDIQVVLVDLTGRAIGPEITVPTANGYITGGTGSGVVFVSGGRVYVADAEGVRPIAVGDALRSTATEVLVHSCDDAARCAPVVVDLSTGRTTRLDRLGGVYNAGQSLLVSPDRIASVGYGPSSFVVGPSTTITIADRSGRVIGTVEVPTTRGEPTWLPGDLGLVVPTEEGASRVFESGGGLVVEPMTGVQRRDNTDRVLVILP